VGADRVKYRLVLFFDLAQIFARAIRVTFKRTDALPRNNQAVRGTREFNEKRLFCVAKAIA